MANDPIDRLEFAMSRCFKKLDQAGKEFNGVWTRQVIFAALTFAQAWGSKIKLTEYIETGESGYLVSIALAFINLYFVSRLGFTLSEYGEVKKELRKLLHFYNKINDSQSAVLSNDVYASTACIVEPLDVHAYGPLVALYGMVSISVPLAFGHAASFNLLWRVGFLIQHQALRTSYYALTFAVYLVALVALYWTLGVRLSQLRFSTPFRIGLVQMAAVAFAIAMFFSLPTGPLS